MHHMYRNVLRIQKACTYSQARGIFGFTPEANIGKVAFPAVQAAPSFPSSFPVPLRGRNEMRCLIPQVRLCCGCVLRWHVGAHASLCCAGMLVPMLCCAALACWYPCFVMLRVLLLRGIAHCASRCTPFLDVSPSRLPICLSVRPPACLPCPFVGMSCFDSARPICPFCSFVRPPPSDYLYLLPTHPPASHAPASHACRPSTRTPTSA